MPTVEDELFNVLHEEIQREILTNPSACQPTRGVSLSDPDIIHFYQWPSDHPDIIVFGCRGLGRTYQDFYRNFLATTSYLCLHDDMPWDYFVFTKPEDVLKFTEKYGKHITPQSDDWRLSSRDIARLKTRIPEFNWTESEEIDDEEV